MLSCFLSSCWILGWIVKFFGLLMKVLLISWMILLGMLVMFGVLICFLVGCFFEVIGMVFVLVVCVLVKVILRWFWKLVFVLLYFCLVMLLWLMRDLVYSWWMECLVWIRLVISGCVIDGLLFLLWLCWW